MPHRLIKDGELILYGNVGLPRFFEDEDGFTAFEVIAALAQVKGDINVRMNSGGGVAVEGISIYNALRARASDSRVTVFIDGIAASAASIIAMGGTSLVMREGSMLMVHNASALTLGAIRDHEDSIESLRVLDASMASIYASATGKAAKDAHKLMDDETWFTALEAVEAGFADKAEIGEAVEPTAFDYRLYARAPQQLVAMADAKFKARIPRASTKRTSNMTTEPKPVDLKALTVDELTAANPDLVKKIEDAAAAKAKAATTADAGDDADVIAKRVRDEVTEEHKQIFAACDIAGMPAKAADFIAEGKKLPEVLASLRKDRAEGKGGNVSARNQPTAGGAAGEESKAKPVMAKAAERHNARFS